MTSPAMFVGVFTSENFMAPRFLPLDISIFHDDDTALAVRALHAELSHHGYRVWSMACDLLPGDVEDLVVPGVLKVSRWRVFVFTIATSERLRETLARAIADPYSGQTNIPVVIGEAEIPFGVNRISRITLPNAESERLIAALLNATSLPGQRHLGGEMERGLSLGIPHRSLPDRVG